MLNTGKPDQVLQFFKNSDVDPRELIMLFKDLESDLRPYLNDHVRLNRGHVYLLERYAKENSMSENASDYTLKHNQAKEEIKKLFHYLNQKYLSELRKDDDK